MPALEEIFAPGKTIESKYRLLEVIGSGGMGVVFKGVHLLIDRPVAMKVLRPELLGSSDFLSRFKREASLASKLSHPGAVTIFDFGLVENIPYLVMEYVEGVTLKQHLTSAKHLDIVELLPLIEQICSTLTAAHSLGIVHRDIKPENIMLCARSGVPPQVKILDFGVAKQVVQSGAPDTTSTVAGLFRGTPRYASPEQIAGKEIDGRSDIYSLGALIYECLTGTPPFQASSVVELLAQHLQAVPARFSTAAPQLRIPPAVEAVVMRCLEKDKNARFSSTTELYQSLVEGAANQVPPTGVAPNQFAILLRLLRSKLHRAATFYINSVAPGYRLPILCAVAILIGGALFLMRREDTASYDELVRDLTAGKAASEPESVSTSSTESSMSLLSSVASSSSEPKDLRSVGFSLYRSKRYAEAVEKLTSVLAQQPDDLEARLALGNCLLRLQRNGEAFSHFSQALSAAPQSPKVHFNLACYYAVIRDKSRALNELSVAVKLDPRVRSAALADPDLTVLQTDPRFDLIMHPKPRRPSRFWDRFGRVFR